MPKKRPETPAYARLNVRVTNETAARIDEARGALKRQGVYVSMSGMVEIALLELLGRRDLAETMRRHNATARRETED
ncbi:MAG TPA: hypothetical protein VGX91_07650 [Candidatus Cybelea sp.]|jgi:Arc/MetJ-type ribon-helix-helix transcriptional regulator|nr:hypothetical protein [Candidatus Cybelea sp.]